MGIAIFAAARMVQAVPTWFDLQWPQPDRPTTAGAPRRHATAGTTTDTTGASLQQKAARMAHQLVAKLGGRVRQGGRMPGEAATPHARSARPLRVLRVVEPQQARSAAGRMVISGRMADVCAELDRLAAAEAASAPAGH